MSAFDNQALEAAIKRYVRACGGDPDGASAEAVLAEREVEQAIEEYASDTSVCDSCGAPAAYTSCEICAENSAEDIRNAG